MADCTLTQETLCASAHMVKAGNCADSKCGKPVSEHRTKPTATATSEKVLKKRKASTPREKDHWKFKRERGNTGDIRTDRAIAQDFTGKSFSEILTIIVCDRSRQGLLGERILEAAKAESGSGTSSAASGSSQGASSSSTSGEMKVEHIDLWPDTLGKEPWLREDAARVLLAGFPRLEGAHVLWTVLQRKKETQAVAGGVGGDLHHFWKFVNDLKDKMAICFERAPGVDLDQFEMDLSDLGRKALINDTADVSEWFEKHVHKVLDQSRKDAVKERTAASAAAAGGGGRGSEDPHSTEQGAVTLSYAQLQTLLSGALGRSDGGGDGGGANADGLHTDGDGGARRPRTCFKCGSTSHLIAVCPNL